MPASTRSPSPARPRSAASSASATAGTGKKLSLELGGKSPFIVFDDADLDSAVEGVVDAIWFNQGQVCCAGSRLLVAGRHRRALYGKLRARMETLRVGDPLDKSTDIGAIVAPVQLAAHRAARRGRRGGGRRVLAARRCSCPQRGCFYPPTLVTGVEPASVLAREEIFGPVLVAMTFRTPDEAVALANNTRYGLAASVWTENVNRALEVAARIKAGVVWINSTNLFDAASGFGGYRESGFGREGGREGPVRISRVASDEAPGEGLCEGGAAQRHARPYALGRRSAPSTARRSSMSAASRRGPTRATATPCSTRRAARSGQAGLGNRKDIRNAVEAAAKASGWGAATGA